MPSDLSRHEAEVIDLYIKKKKTAEQTIRILNQKYNSEYNVRQFKSTFGGLRKIQAKEWKAVGLATQVQRERGVEFDVYLCNQLQSRERVKREIKRNINANGDGNASSIDLGFETIGKHRIEIRTRVAAPANLTLNFISAIQASEIHESRSPGFTNQFPSSVELESGRDVQMDDTLILGPTSLTENDPIDVEIGLQNVAEQNFLSQSPLVHSVSNPRLTLQAPRNTGRYRLFWQEPEIRRIIANWPLSAVPSCHIPNLAPLGSPEWLLTQIGQPTASILKCVPDFMKEVSKTISGDIREMDVKSTFEGADTKTLNRAFSIVAFLACNNLLSKTQLQSFAFWVLENDQIAKLANFLETVSPSIKDFRTKILQVTCQAPGILQIFHFTNGETVYREVEDNSPHKKKNCNLFVTHTTEALTLLRSLDARAVSGLLATELLMAASASNHKEIVEFLLGNGANANGYGNKHPSAIAAAKGSIAVLECLIKNGAEVDPKAPEKEESCWASPLAVAILYGQYDATAVLLNAGVKINMNFNISTDNVLNFAKREWPRIYNLLLDHIEKDDMLTSWRIVEHAQRGNVALTNFLTIEDMFQDEILEQGLYYAVKWGKAEAVRTFLYRRVDPNIHKFRSSSHGATHTTTSKGNDSKSATSDTLEPLREAVMSTHWYATDIIYLLVTAGGRLSNTPMAAKIPENMLTLVHAGYDMTEFGPSILEMIDEGEIRVFGPILDAGCPIDAYGVYGKSPLQIASRNRNLALVQYLLDRGASINLEANSEGGRTALQAALESGHCEVANYLLDIGADVMAPPAKTDGITALEAAAAGLGTNPRFFSSPSTREHRFHKRNWEKEFETFKRLIHLGTPVTRDGLVGEGNSPLLHLLISSQNFECLELVLKAGASTQDRPKGYANLLCRHQQRQDSYERATALQFAAHLLSLQAMRLLLDHKANVNAPASPENGFTALQAVAELNQLRFSTSKDQLEARAELQLRAAYLFLEHGAEINAAPAEQFGRTALQTACSQKNTNYALVQLLLENGADINASPARVGGITALQGAIKVGDQTLVMMLLSRGADPNPEASEGGRTAVEMAAENGRLDILRCLLNMGTRPDMATKFSRAIKLAEEKGYWAIVELLEEHQHRCHADMLTLN